MFRNRSLWLVVALAACLLGSLVGCARNDDAPGVGPMPVAPTATASDGRATLRLAFAVTPNDEGTVTPALRATTKGASVTIQLLSFHPGDATTPITYQSVNAIADANNRVSVSVDLPALPTVAKVSINGGSIGSYTAFRGGIDLVANTGSTLVVHPAGSGLRGDLVAQAMEHIMMTPTRRALAGVDLAAKATAAIAQVDRTMPVATVYANLLEATQRLVAAARGRGAVSGRVNTVSSSGSQRGAVRGAVAAGAKVYVENHPDLATTTAADGSFTLANIPAGVQNIIVDDDKGTVAGHFKGRSPAVSVAAETTAPIADLNANAAPNQIDGYVYLDTSMSSQQNTQIPVEGVRVTVWGQVSTTDANGHYTVFNMPQGTWDVQYEKVGFETRVDPVSFGVGQGTTHSITFKSLDKFPPIVSGLAAVNVNAYGARIDFATNEPAVCRIDYGPTTAYGTRTDLEYTAVRDHQIQLSFTGEAGATWHYRITARDVFGNEVTTPDVTVRAVENGDTTPPVVSGVQSTPQNWGAQIRFNTDENAVARIEFGLDEQYAYHNEFSYGLTREHTIDVSFQSISGFAPGATVKYRIAVRDASNNTTTTSGYTVATIDNVAPQLVSGGLVLAQNVTATSATIVWQTDEPSSSEVDYGRDYGFASRTADVATRTTNHVVLLTGLSPYTYYYVRAVSKDSANNGGEWQIGFQTLAQSVAPPVVTGPARTNNAQPTWTWSGGSGVTTFRWRLDDPDLSYAGAGNSTTFTPNEALPEGPHTLYVQAQSSAADGNWSTTAAFTVLVDLPALAPVVTGATYSSTLRPTWSWLSGGAGSGTYRVLLDNADLSGVTTTQTERSFTPGTNLTDGQHTLYVQEQDGYPQWSPSGSFVIEVGMRFDLFAGQIGLAGTTNGASATAQFNNPAALAMDSGGNLYVAEKHEVRKITAAGAVSRLAGGGLTPGSDDLQGAAARFNNPMGLAIDGSGIVYVADCDNHTIRKIDASGNVTTFAGAAGVSGSDDNPTAGQATNARFANPQGLAFDGAGNLYVADTGNHTIRKITAGGVVTTVVGMAGESGSAGGSGTDARLYAPTDLAFSGTDLYIVDSGNAMIRKYSSDTNVAIAAGFPAGSQNSPGYQDGTGTAARFSSPRRICRAGDGSLIIADTGNHVIRRLTTAGVVTTVAGLAGDANSVDGVRSQARFSAPNGVAVDAAGNIYVSEENSHVIRTGNYNR